MTSLASSEKPMSPQWLEGIGAGNIALLALLAVYPAVASDFFLTQIGAYSLILGMIALSLMLLAGYGGMVSLAQISVAGIAGYAVAIFGLNNSGVHGFGWDPVFQSDGETRTYGELTGAEKDAVSHRGRAWRDLLGKLAQAGARELAALGGTEPELNAVPRRRPAPPNR